MPTVLRGLSIGGNVWLRYASWGETNVRSLLFRFITLVVVRLGGRGRLREKLWDENLLCQTLSVHRETVKFRASFFFFSFFSRLGKMSFLEEKNLKCREKIGATFDQLVSLLRSKFENLEILKGKSDYERNWKILCARFYLFIVKVFQSLFF